MKRNDGIHTERLIRMVQDACLIVHPPDDGRLSDSFRPFWFRCMPASQSRWFNSLAETLHRTCNRGIAVLLIVDCESQRWSAPIIPVQRSSREETCWALRSEDFANMPRSCRVVGACQSGVVKSSESLVACLPPYDGVHLFLRNVNNEWVENWFVRTEGKVSAVSPLSVLEGDRRITREAQPDPVNVRTGV